MDRVGLEQIIRDVFGNPTTQEIGGWLCFPCPLSTWQHESGRDSRASFGISIQPSGVSVAHCFTCGCKLPLHALLQKWAAYTGEDLDTLIDEVEEQAYLGPREIPEWGAATRADSDPVPLKQSVYLDLYDSAAGHPYLRSRGISEATTERLQLKVDPADPADGEERILFPVFSPTGDLHGMSGRATSPGARLKVRDYQGLPKSACLLGAHLIAQAKPDKILVVEGLFDFANCWEQGFPAVAVMHSALTKGQASILRDFALPVYLFFDDDAAGRKGVATAGKALFAYIPVMKVRYPEVWVDDGLGGKHRVKDPGELSKDEIEFMISDSRLWFPL